MPLSVKQFLQGKRYSKPVLDNTLKIQAPTGTELPPSGVFGTSLETNINKSGNDLLESIRGKIKRIPIVGKVFEGVQKIGQIFTPKSSEEAKRSGYINVGSLENPTYLDVTGFSGSMEEVSARVTKKVAQKIAESSVVDDIFKVLKGSLFKGGAVKNVADDALRSLADDLVKVTDPNQIKPFIENSLKGIEKRAEGLLTRIKLPQAQKATSVASEGIKPTSDAARINEIRNSINEGNTLLRGKDLTVERRSQIVKSLENAQAKIGVEAKDGYKIQELSSDQIFNRTGGIGREDLTKQGLKNWENLVKQGKAEVRDGKFYKSEAVTQDLQPLAQEAGKYKSAEEFVNKFDRIAKESGERASNDPYLKLKKITPEEEAFRQKVFEYTGTPEVIKRYEAGATDKQILTDFYNQATKGGTKSFADIDTVIAAYKQHGGVDLSAVRKEFKDSPEALKKLDIAQAEVKVEKARRAVLAKREKEYGEKLNALANKTRIMSDDATLNNNAIRDFQKAEYELAKQFPDISPNAEKIAYYEKTHGISEVTKKPTGVGVTKTASELPSKLAQKTLQAKSPLPSPSQLKVGQEISLAKQTLQPTESALKKGITYLDDATELAKSKVLNTDNLNISKEAKTLIDNALEGIKPELEKLTGKVLTNKEVADIAERSSKVLKNVVGVEQTRAWEVAMLNARKRMAEAAQSGTVTKQFLDDLAVVKTQGTDIARKLQSLGMKANPEDATLMNAVIEKILQTGANADEVLKASKGVDFNDFKQAAEFYRKYVSPKWTEWIDLLRYNSMLSSPLTHITNIVSNVGQTLVVAPLEKLTLGGVDFLQSVATGKGRKYLAGEALPYLEGYFKNIGEGFKRFAGVMKGERAFTNLDVKRLPVATKGAKGVAEKVLSYPMRLLEGADQFFTALTQGAEEAGMAYRASKGIKVANIEAKAAEKAQYRLFRQGLFNENQGAVLDAIDTVTNKLLQARNSKNPIVSTISKFTIPFIQTPTNIFKQGLEYSPLGFTTAIGAKNKTEQIAKAILGSAIFAGGATLLASGRITGQEPIDTTNKQLWRQAGKQPYSIKFGDKWVSYQKLPPAFSFPLSMVAILNDLNENKKIDDTFLSLALRGISKNFQFLSDQSYAKSIGDFMSAAQGEQYSFERLLSNYPTQLIPFRALTGWMARLSDQSQREVDGEGFIEKQMQLLMMNYPGLIQKTPARLDKEGQPIPNQNRFWNALSPVRIQSENKKFADFLESNTKFKKETQIKQAQNDKEKEKIRPIYDQVQLLLQAGDNNKAQEIVNGLSDEEYTAYKKIKTSEKTKLTNKKEVDMFPLYQEIQSLLEVGNIEEATKMVDDMTDEEYRIYKILKDKFSPN